MEVTGVIMAIDTMTLTWPAVATATRYDVVRGSTTALPVGPGGGDEACFAGLTDTLLFDATNPAAGGGSFYLVRSASACGVSTFGTQSNGALRATTTCP